MHDNARSRTRWAALGAAVAVTLGAGGVGLVDATIGNGERNVFVAIEPCRIFDTRPDFSVGPKTTPLGEQETHSVKGVGAVGECELPPDATGLVLNVTAVGATRPTFLTIWGAGADRPNASHLNPLPGDGPAPNAVTTDLGVDDEFNVFNRFGTVHVLADVVGYYADHHHDDRYYTRNDLYTKAQTDSALEGLVTARAHGQVYYNGTVQAGRNLSSDNVTNPATGVYCIVGLPFTPVNAIVSNSAVQNAGAKDVRIYVIGIAGSNCGIGSQMEIHVYAPGTSTLSPGNFNIVIF